MPGQKKTNVNSHLSDFDLYIKTLKKQQLIKEYKNIRGILDNALALFEEKDVSKTLRKSFNEFINFVKKTEMKYRIAAYPERNQVPMTYDELKELSEALRGWKCVKLANNGNQK